jgi:hypothetical protein
MKEPESVDPLLQGIRRRNRRILMATILVFVLPLGYVTRSFALSASHGYRNFENRFFDRESYEHDLTAEQSATIGKALDEARAHGADFKKAWRTAIDTAIAAGITGRADLGRCPTSVLGPSHFTEGLPAMPSWLTVAKTPEAVASIESAIGSSRDRELTSLEARAKRGHTDREAERLVKEVQAFSKDAAWTWEVLMVIDKRVEPAGSGKGADFTSGEIEARAFLYDYQRGAVTCAGRVHAENSDEIRFKSTSRGGIVNRGDGVIEAADSLGAALGNDLTVEGYRAAAEAVQFRAGPPLLQEP